MHRTIHGPSTNPQSVISLLRLAADWRGFSLRLLIICSLERAMLEKYLLLFSEDGNVGMKLALTLISEKGSFCPVNLGEGCRERNPFRQNLVAFQLVACAFLKMPRTIIRAYGHALPRRYAEERILPSFRANEPLRSLYLLSFCAMATDAPCGTKVKGFSKRADSYRQEKKRGTNVLFDHRSFSFYCRTLGMPFEYANT